MMSGVVMEVEKKVIGKCGSIWVGKYLKRAGIEPGDEVVIEYGGGKVIIRKLEVKDGGDIQD